MSHDACPCASGKKLKACCGPFLDGTAEPATAELLMRSRYTAFAKKHVAHLVRTLDRAHPDAARDPAAVARDLLRSMRDVRFMGVDILGARGPDDEGVARVVFVAKLFEKGTDRSFAECSEFRHDGTGWRYRQGVGKPAAAVRGVADPFAPFEAARTTG